MWWRRQRAWLEQWRKETVQRAEADRKRHEAWLVEWRVTTAERQLEQRRRFDEIDARLENDKRVTREMILDLREQTAMLRDMRHGIQANTEGLLRILDELRRNEWPSAAGPSPA